MKGGRNAKEVEDFAARVFNARKKRRRAHRVSARRAFGQLLQHEEESKHDTVGEHTEEHEEESKHDTVGEHTEESKHDTDTDTVGKHTTSHPSEPSTIREGILKVDDEDLELLDAMDMDDFDNEDSSDGSGVDADIA